MEIPQQEETPEELRQEIEAYFAAVKRHSQETWYEYGSCIRTICIQRDKEGQPTLSFISYEDKEAWLNQVVDVSLEFALLAVRNRRMAKLRVINWVNASKCTGGTIAVKLSAPASLLDYLEIPFPWKKIRMAAPVPKMPDVPGPPREACKKLYDMMDLRGKLMMGLNMCASRVGAYKWFKLKDIEVITVDGVKFGKITIYPDEPEEYPSYLTPEFLHNLDLYLEQRKLAGEIITPESPIVRNKFSIFNAHKPRAITPGGVKRYFTDAWLKAGYPTKLQAERGAKGEVRGWTECHGYRKFAETELENDGVSHETAELILGHLYRYKKMEDIDIQKVFVKHMHVLMFSDEFKLKKQVDEKQGTIDRLEENLSSMKGDIASMKRQINEFTKKKR